MAVTGALVVALAALAAAGFMLLDADDTRIFAPAHLGVELEIPVSWGGAEARLGLGEHFDDVVDSPDGAYALMATRVIRSGTFEASVRGHPARRRQLGASNLSFEAAQVDEQAAQRLIYELASPWDPDRTLRVVEYQIDAGDGTDIHVAISGPSGSERDDELLESIERSITIGDLRLPVEVQRLSVDAHDFAGEFWASSHEAAGPAVVLIGGDEGGFPWHGRQIARAGHPTLSLAYWTGHMGAVPGLPNQLEEIPLEYFETAIRWLADQPEVDPDRIYLWGTSRGGEAALLVASTYPDLVHGVVAHSPSSIMLESFPHGGSAAWSLDGQPLPFSAGIPWSGVPDLPAAEIPVERIEGPILLVCGQRDNVLPSCQLSGGAIDRLEQHGSPHRVELLALDDLGHTVTRATRSVLSHPSEGNYAWRATLDFIDATSS